MAESNERWERIERGIEHLVNTAAKHDVEIALHKERLERHDGALQRIDAALETMLDSQKQLLTAQVVFVDETRKAIDRLVESQRRTDEQIQLLKAQSSDTDERLNALISTVDAIIRRPQAPPQMQ